MIEDKDLRVGDIIHTKDGADVYEVVEMLDNEVIVKTLKFRDNLREEGVISPFNFGDFLDGRDDIERLLRDRRQKIIDKL